MLEDLCGDNFGVFLNKKKKEKKPREKEKVSASSTAVETGPQGPEYRM